MNSNLFGIEVNTYVHMYMHNYVMQLAVYLCS